MTSSLYTIAKNTGPQSSDVNQLVNVFTGTVDGGQLTLFDKIENPSSAPSVTSAGSGALTGTYAYGVTFVTGIIKSDGTMVEVGETGMSPPSTGVAVTSQQFSLSSIPTGPSGTIARKVYRNQSSGSATTGPFYLVTTIQDNVTTAITDNTPDSSLGAQVSYSNTTGTSFNRITATMVQSEGYQMADTGASGNGQWGLVASISLHSQYDYAGLLLSVADGNSLFGPAHALVWFQAQQQNAMGGAPNVSLSVMENEYLGPSDVAYVVSQNNANVTEIDLWIRQNHTYQHYHYSPLHTINPSSLSYYNQFALQGIPGGSVSASIATAIMPSYIAPTLQNGWTNMGGSFATVGYFKGPDSVVHLKGMIKAGTVTNGTVLFNLPAGYRPLNEHRFAVPSGNGTSDVFGEISVQAIGNVAIIAGSGAGGWISLDCSFLAEQ